MKKLPDGFLWGVATSSYQIEGSLDVDGRGASIWDGFVTESGDNGNVATDHYRRWEEDVELLASLGVNAYRFSIAWPRLFPQGDTHREQRGFDFYDRLIDALLERGIEPLVTLYHWDLPATLDWRSRDTVERFAEYARACFDAYGDRVDWWITQNEPWIVGLLGYLHGIHAPGYKNDVLGEVTVFHHLLLAHGRAVQELRASAHPDAKAGVAFALAPHYPASDEPADHDVAHASDGYVNRWFLDAVLKGTYPDDMRARYEEIVGPLHFIREGDLETINAGSDFVGVNYYARRVMKAVPGDHPWPWKVVVGDAPTTAGGTGGVAMTDAGTEITPHALTDLLVRLRADYDDIPIVITENGAVFPEREHDERRVRYIHDHLAAILDAIEHGVPVVGYCYWSFLDNLEWALGYAQRFGLVHVDYDTLERTVKDSGHYYAKLARANALLEPGKDA